MPLALTFGTCRQNPWSALTMALQIVLCCAFALSGSAEEPDLESFLARLAVSEVRFNEAIEYRIAEDNQPVEGPPAEDTTHGVRGTVVDAVGKSVAGARVEATYLDGTAPTTTLSDEAGAYWLRRVVPHKRFYVWVEENGLICRLGPHSLRPRSGIHKFVLVLREPVRIEGSVLATDGRPVADAQVSIHVHGVALLEITKTDEDGRFAFGGLYPVEHDIWVAGALERVELRPGQPQASITLVVDPDRRFTISGHVSDPSGKPVWQARVSAMPHDLRGKGGVRGLPNALTNQEGFYRIQGLREGKHDLRVRHSDFSSVRRHNVPAASEDVNLTLKKPALVLGQVVDASSSEALLDYELAIRYGKLERLSPKMQYLFESVKNSEGRFWAKIDACYWKDCDAEERTVTLVVRAVGFRPAMRAVSIKSAGQRLTGVSMPLQRESSLEEPEESGKI